MRGFIVWLRCVLGGRVALHGLTLFVRLIHDLPPSVFNGTWNENNNVPTVPGTATVLGPDTQDSVLLRSTILQCPVESSGDWRHTVSVFMKGIYIICLLQSMLVLMYQVCRFEYCIRRAFCL